MKPITQEWIDKAEEDFVILNRELRARKSPSLNGACFHAQQCAEKYLKARLYEGNIAFQKTHDLDDLLDLLRAVEPLWTFLKPACSSLTDYAVKFRYPGDSADRAETLVARKDARQIRSEVRKSLGLPE